MNIPRLVVFLLASLSVSGCGVTAVPGPSAEPGWGGQVTAVSYRRPSVQARRPVEQPVQEAKAAKDADEAHASVTTTVGVSAAGKPAKPASKFFTDEWYAAEAEKDRELKRKLITCRGC